MSKIKTIKNIDSKKIGDFTMKIVPNVVLCFGILLISYGAGEIYKPAGYIALGVMAIIAIFTVDFKS